MRIRKTFVVLVSQNQIDDYLDTIANSGASFNSMRWVDDKILLSYTHFNELGFEEVSHGKDN